MNCQKCKTVLAYGAKYCNQCGEKVPKGAYEPEYNNTVWSKIDRAKDKYDSLFLKKITGSLIFKIISMVVVLAYFFITLYGNFMEIRLKDSDAYTIEYNKEAGEYYIYPEEELSQLELYVPIGTEYIVFTEVSKGAENVKEYTPELYKEQGYSISAGEHEYISVDAVQKDKNIDTVKLIVVEK